MSMKYWQGGEERAAERAAEFKHGKVVEQGPSVDDYVPRPGVDCRCTSEQPCPKALDPVGISWAEGCWCYRNPDRDRSRDGTVEPDMGQLITDEINADPEEVERLRRARVEARTGRRRRFTEILDQVMTDNAEALGPGVEDDDFFEEDEPIEDIIAAWDAGEKQLTEPPAGGVGWCAPSP